MRVHSKTSSGKLSKDQKVHLRHSRYSEMQNFRQIMTPPVKFFDSRNFQKHQRPSTNFLADLDKNFLIKFLISPVCVTQLFAQNKWAAPTLDCYNFAFSKL